MVMVVLAGQWVLAGLREVAQIVMAMRVLKQMRMVEVWLLTTVVGADRIDL